MNIKLIVLIFLIPFTLGSCARFLPLDYNDYQGNDAATIYIPNQKGNVGTIYLTTYQYNSKDSCYDMINRYELDSNILSSNGSILVNKIEPNKQYAIEQIKNKGEYIHNLYSSFIPDEGKYYYISAGTRAVEIPESFIPTLEINEDEIINRYGKNKINFWNVKNRCSRAWWHVG